MHPLTVYKASAGSGKTFTLAVEFIKLLIVNPRKYENILAVTFTNKATEEMKHRIVSQLYGLSHGLESSNSYLKKICSELDVTEDFVRKNADIALHNLLHNYNQFRVQTIDAFFQSILRNMVKELGLGNNLHITLNDSQVISEAVDSIMETLDQDKALMSWIIDYVNERMDDKKSWDITGEVKSFGMNLSKEFFKSNEHLLSAIEKDQNFFKRYKETLLGIIKGTEAHFKECGEYFFTMIEENGYTATDFAYGKTGVLGYFFKLKAGDYGLSKSIVGSRVQAAMDDPMKWGTTGGKGKVGTASAIAPLAEERLIPYLKQIEKERQTEIPKVRSAIITLKNINKMRLLFSIREEMDRLNQENARFLLSNTQMVLSHMIQDDTNIAPFIYEKIGAYLQHIMIDEFQDTSTVQWDNFKVLLENCMAGGEEETLNKGAINNLIVGDVKQSIYRFRSGDWRLLNDINNEFGHDMLNIETLATNWRSERNIISFNNSFFKAVYEIEADRIMPDEPQEQQTFITDKNLSAEAAHQLNTYAMALRHAYSDVAQEIPKSKPARGLVRIELLPEEKKEEYDAAAKARTLEYVRSLISQNVKPSDIAILVRFNYEASDIATYFAENAPELSIVSEQAFTLAASPLVMMIISTLRLLRNSKDKQAEVLLLKLYMSYIIGEDIPDGSLLTAENPLETFLPAQVASPEAMEMMHTMPLYELTEHIYRNLSLSKLEGQAPYATAFLDGMKKYMEDNVATIEEFLDYWDSELSNKAIAVGGGESIRVITIHKSKGLEFKHLVMPFCNWNMASRHTETLWCTINDQPFSELPFIPVDYINRNSLQNSIFESFGNEEWMQSIVDNLNLLYVAFTRAGRSLFVLANQQAKEDNRCYALIKALHKIIDSNVLKGASFEDNAPKSSDEEATAPSIFTFGEHYLDEKEEKESDNVFERIPTAIPVNVESFNSTNVSFRQSNKSREFANDTLDDEDSKRYTTMGSVMHMLFSRIRTIADIDKELRQFEFDGVIYDDTLTSEQLRKELKQKFSHPTVSSWFSDRWTVFNECNIMRLMNGKIVEDRPDRVITDGNETIVIDYKFGQKNAAYVKQVQRYMTLMQQMGYPNVHGYLWYVNLDEVESVEL